MAVDLSKHPLLALMDHVNRWAKSARSEAFWQALAEHLGWAERLRDEAKGILVWLELRGEGAAAARLDEAMGKFREALWAFERACDGTYPPEDARCRERREALLERAGQVAGVAEDLDNQVPDGVWEGYRAE